MEAGEKRIEALDDGAKRNCCVAIPFLIIKKFNFFEEDCKIDSL